MKMPTSPVVLAPTDMSDASAPSVTYATDLGRRLGALVVVFHAVSRKELEQGVAEGRSLDAQIAHARDQLAAWFEASVPAPDREGARVQMAAAFGLPDEEILAKAAALQAAIIVMATHGRTGLPRAMLGSVAEAVLRRASCPVLTIRTTARMDAPRFPVPATGSRRRATGESAEMW